MKTTPLTPILAAEGAEFGVVNGWERVAYIKPSPDFQETHGFRFNEAFDVVAAEVKAACSGFAVNVEEIPNSSLAWVANASNAINWLATWLANALSSPRLT